MSIKTTAITPELYDYILQKFVREPEVARRLRQETYKLAQAQMQTPPEEACFLNFLVTAMRARKTLEVGVFTGYSALWTALALPADGELIACDISEEWTSIGQRYWKEAGVASKIRLRLGPASETLSALLSDSQANSFDFAFIDADKPNYEEYYEKVYQLVRPGGVIAIDNVLRSGDVLDTSVNDPGTAAVRALNEKLSRDERIHLSMLPIADGLTLAIKRE